MPTQPPIPAAPAVGDAMTANWADQVSALLGYLVNPPSFQGYQAAAQSVANNVFFVAMVIDTNLTDNYSGHSTVTNNSRYTSQVAGTYHVYATAEFGANVTGRRIICLFKNGVQLGYTQAEIPASTAAGGVTAVNVSWDVPLAVNDYVEAKVYQSSGGALAMTAGGSGMTVRWVSP